MTRWHNIDESTSSGPADAAVPAIHQGPFASLADAESLFCVYGLIGDYRQQISGPLRLHVAKAVDKRQREFAAGRHFAATALAHSGSREVEVSVHPAHTNHPAPRAPIWPKGRVGSISHSTRRAWVAVASSQRWLSVGVDLEELGRVGSELYSAVFTEAELARYDTEDADPRWPETVFSAKEAVYKAINPIVGKYIGFTEAEVDLRFASEGDSGEFRIRYIGEHLPNKLMEQGQGYFALHDDHCLCLFLVPHPA